MNRLRQLRKKKGLTIREMAEKVNISFPTLSRLENDETSFTSEYLETLTDFFDVSIDYLLGRTDKPNYDKEQLSYLDDFQFALYDKVKGKDLSERQKKDILDIIDLLTKDDD